MDTHDADGYVENKGADLPLWATILIMVMLSVGVGVLIIMMMYSQSIL